jgi:hypothetical protein
MWVVILAVFHVHGINPLGKGMDHRGIHACFMCMVCVWYVYGIYGISSSFPLKLVARPPLSQLCGKYMGSTHWRREVDKRH